MYRLRFERRAVDDVFVQRLEQRFGRFDPLRGTRQLEFVAAIANPHAHATLDELEVLVERPTQGSEAAGVVGFERYAGGQRDDAIRLVRQTTMRFGIGHVAFIDRRAAACQMKFPFTAPRSVFVIASVIVRSTNCPCISRRPPLKLTTRLFSVRPCI